VRVFQRLNVEVRILPYRHCAKSSKYFIPETFNSRKYKIGGYYKPCFAIDNPYYDNQINFC